MRDEQELAMEGSQDRGGPRQADWLGLMLAECSFAYLGWLNARSDSKLLWSDGQDAH
jgi:hypothetical protein